MRCGVFITLVGDVLEISYIFRSLLFRKCSNNIFIPNSININPPTNCAFFSYFAPNILPIFTPISDSMNVIIPMQVTENTMLHFRNANVIPIANASMLVAIASIIIFLKSMLSLFSFSASCLSVCIIWCTRNAGKACFC